MSQPQPRPRHPAPAAPAASPAPAFLASLLLTLAALGVVAALCAVVAPAHAQEPVDEAESIAAAAADMVAAEPPPAEDEGARAPLADGEEHVVLATNHGTLTLRLFPDEAPETVANFKRLVAEGFYDGQPFYRVVAGHVIQAGDGGENEQPTVPLEAEGHPHVEGAVGLARDSDPHSGSTEFYICLAPRPHLDGRYAVFGQVVDGYDVLREIGAVPVDEQWLGDDGQVAFHSPKEEVVIEHARVAVAGAAAGDDGDDGDAETDAGSVPGPMEETDDPAGGSAAR